MHVSSRWLLLWPGLALLWARGSWWGLSAALGFTVIGNLLLTASWMWTEWFGPSTVADRLGIVRRHMDFFNIHCTLEME